MAAQREWFEKDYYKVLGVVRTATAKEITKAYRTLARNNHPDTHPGDDAAEERFKDVSAAYDVLGDEEKRKEYDEVRASGPTGGFGGPMGRRLPGGAQLQRRRRRARRPARADVRSRPSRRRGVGRRRSARGDDLEASLTLDFADAVHGPHHHAVPHRRRAVQHLQRQRCEARHPAEGVLALRRPWRHRRQPGLLLALLDVPAMRRRGVADRGPVPDVSRLAGRAPSTRGPGAHPRRASPTVRRSGSRVAAHPVATAVRRAT